MQPGGPRVRPGIKSSHPITGQPVTGQQITGHPVTGHPLTGQPVTSHPVTGQPGTGQPGTGQPGTSYQSFAYDFQNQFIPGYSPVSVPLQNYAPSISSHVSHGTINRLPNVHTPGYEHSEMSESPNDYFFQTVNPT